MPFVIILQSAPEIKMRKLHIKRSSFLIEPANRNTETPCTDDKVSVLEILGEIGSLMVIGVLGWLALIIL